MRAMHSSSSATSRSPTPDLRQCTREPPSSSCVTSSPTAARTRCGPASAIEPRPLTIGTKSASPGMYAVPGRARAHQRGHLRDHAARDHLLAEQVAGAREQRADRLLDPRAGRVEQPHERDPLGQRQVAQPGDLHLAGHAHRPGHHREVVGAHRDQPAVDLAVAGDHAVGRRLLALEPAHGVVDPGVDAQLRERAVVDQQVEPLARGELLLRVLARDPLLAPAELRLRAPLVQVVDERAEHHSAASSRRPAASSSASAPTLPSSCTEAGRPCSAGPHGQRERRGADRVPRERQLEHAAAQLEVADAGRRRDHRDGRRDDQVEVLHQLGDALGVELAQADRRLGLGVGDAQRALHLERDGRAVELAVVAVQVGVDADDLAREPGVDAVRQREVDRRRCGNSAAAASTRSRTSGSARSVQATPTRRSASESSSARLEPRRHRLQHPLAARDVARHRPGGVVARRQRPAAVDRHEAEASPSCRRRRSTPPGSGSSRRSRCRAPRRRARPPAPRRSRRSTRPRRGRRRPGSAPSRSGRSRT